MRRNLFSTPTDEGRSNTPSVKSDSAKGTLETPAGTASGAEAVDPEVLEFRARFEEPRPGASLRVLLVNRHYGGEQVPTGRMLRDVARELVQQGHRVEVLTTRNGYEGTAEAEGDEADISVTYVPTLGIRLRFCRWFIFWLTACVLIPLKRWNRCLILTDPPFMAVAAWLAALLRKMPRKAYLWTMDLYPESLVASGLLRENKLLYRALVGLNELGLGAVAGGVCLGECQRRRLERYRNFSWSENSCLVIPPWDRRAIQEVGRTENRFLKKYGLESKKVALYAGNVGRAHSSVELLRAARELDAQGDQEWVFVFIVRGSHKATLVKESAGLRNMVVTDYQPPELTSDMLRAANVHLITMQPGWEGIVVPSKLYSTLKTKAPVLYIGPLNSDTADEIRKWRAGTVLPPGCTAQEVVCALRELGSRERGEVAFLSEDWPRRVASFITE